MPGWAGPLEPGTACSAGAGAGAGAEATAWDGLGQDGMCAWARPGERAALPEARSVVQRSLGVVMAYGAGGRQVSSRSAVVSGDGTVRLAVYGSTQVAAPRARAGQGRAEGQQGSRADGGQQGRLAVSGRTHRLLTGTQGGGGRERRWRHMDALFPTDKLPR